MVLSYARGLWRFKVASLVASSVAVAVRYGNVGGSFSGNEELVSGLMAECDGKNGAADFGGKGGDNFAWQKFSLKFSNQILVAAEVSKRLHTPSVTKRRWVYMAHVDRKGVRETF